MTFARFEGCRYTLGTENWKTYSTASDRTSKDLVSIVLERLFVLCIIIVSLWLAPTQNYSSGEVFFPGGASRERKRCDTHVSTN